jgi:hypothetical protein
MATARDQSADGAAIENTTAASISKSTERIRYGGEMAVFLEATFGRQPGAARHRQQRPRYRDPDSATRASSRIASIAPVGMFDDGEAPGWWGAIRTRSAAG